MHGWLLVLGVGVGSGLGQANTCYGIAFDDAFGWS